MRRAERASRSSHARSVWPGQARPGRARRMEASQTRLYFPLNIAWPGLAFPRFVFVYSSFPFPLCLHRSAFICVSFLFFPLPPPLFESYFLSISPLNDVSPIRSTGAISPVRLLLLLVDVCSVMCWIDPSEGSASDG